MSKEPGSAMQENARRVMKRETNPHLFRPVTYRSVTARNRIMVSPMCQYSATDGVPEAWHLVHLGARAAGGAGFVVTEATHVEARGRITPNCLGLWNDAQRDAFKPIAAFISAQGAVPGVQLAHAGRKASISRPWDGNRPLGKDEGGWDVIGPSAIPFADGWPTPTEMDTTLIAEAVDAFASAARRAREAGFKLVELHMAHGYLGHSFLSPLSNRRGDAYGGSLENRARFLMDCVDAVRGAWPGDLPLFVRLSCSDWIDGGLDIADTVEIAKMLKARGDVDLIDCSSGGNSTGARIPTHNGYQTPFADRIRNEAGIATGALGMIHTPEQAEEILGNGRADIVVLARALLDDPHWPLHAAKKLKAENVAWPLQYERGNIF